MFRLGTLFGVSDNFSRIRMDLVVNTLSAKAFFEKKMSVFGGEQYRPLLHVKDVARAIEVAKIMMQNGVQSNRINVAGYGEFRPLVANDSLNNREKNRRIELNIS